MRKFGCRVALLSVALLVFVTMSAAEARAGGGPCGWKADKSAFGDWKAAKLAKFDLNGDGKLSVLEQAKMRLAWKMKHGDRAGACGMKAKCGPCGSKAGACGMKAKCGGGACSVR